MQSWSGTMALVLVTGAVGWLLYEGSRGRVGRRAFAGGLVLGVPAAVAQSRLLVAAMAMPLNRTLVPYLVIYVLLAWSGLSLSARAGFPGLALWPRSLADAPGDGRPREGLVLTGLLAGVALGAALGGLNFALIRWNRAVGIPWPVWFTPLRGHPSLIALMSAQAALTEEITFRLFLFPAVAVLLGRLGRLGSSGLSPRGSAPPAWAVVAGLAAQAVLFGAIHGLPGLALGVASGAALGVVAYFFGIETCMVAHLLGDLLSWGFA